MQKKMQYVWNSNDFVDKTFFISRQLENQLENSLLATSHQKTLPIEVVGNLISFESAGKVATTKEKLFKLFL